MHGSTVHAGKVKYHMYNQEILSLFLFKLIHISIIISFGLLGITFIARIIAHTLEQRGTPHMRMITNKIIWYSGIILLIITILNELGFQLSALLGAAGIFGVAIGFASQTSMSNVISGLFLLSENFLAIGDSISCGSVQGKVESIDLFSIKVRTPDGKLVRLPNERLIKDTLINETYYPMRRVEIAIAIPGDLPLDELLHTIDKVIEQNQYVAQDPKHMVILQSLSTDASHIIIQVWTSHIHLKIMKNTLIRALKKLCEENSIKTLYVMSK